MQNLITFLRRYFNFFLLIVLEIICLSLVFNSREYQQTVWLHSANKLTGKLFQKVNGISQYIDLKSVNKHLNEQNTALLNQLPAAFSFPDTTSGVKVDSLGQRQYLYFGARVVNNSVSQLYNYLTIHRGRNQEIEVGMGVIGAHGVVGIVRNVSDNYAVVMTLLNRKARVSALLPRTGNFGSVVWQNTPPDPQYGQLLDIPSNITVRKGDSVLTSGYSAIFPKGLVIGQVSDVQSAEGGSFYQIDLKFAEDFQSLQYVYVIKNLNAQEQREVEKKVEHE